MKALRPITAYTHAYICAYIHTYMHTYIRTFLFSNRKINKLPNYSLTVV